MWIPKLFKSSGTLYVIAFVSKILVFSVIYLLIFRISPDAFRFASDYNVAPLSSYWSTFYDTDDPSSIAMSGVPADLENFRIRAAELEKAYNKWQACEKDQRSAEKSYNAIMQRLSAETDRNTEEYIDKNITPMEREVANIQEKLADAPLSQNEILILLKKSQKLNEEIFSRYDFIISHRPSFIPDSLRMAEAAANAELSLASATTIEAQDEFQSERNKLADDYRKARDRLTSKIGWTDFLYFSSCVSTTTTFGDIVGNNTPVRILVALQIFSGIIIVSLMLNAISGTHTSRNEH